MRTHFLCLSVLLSALNVTLNAQPTWEWQNPRPQGNNFTCIEAPNSQIAYAVGECGSTVKTTTGGTTWQLLHFPLPVTSKSLQFTDLLSGWATGTYRDSVYLLSTIDGGSTWVIPFRSRGTNISFYFLSASHRWLSIDSSLYRSTNGGITWQLLYSGFSFVQLHFDNANTGWGIGSQFFLRTSDGGSSWARTTINLGLGFTWLQQCRFVDTTIGWMIGRLSGPNLSEGHVLKTTDGGTNWQEQLKVGMRLFDYDAFSGIESVSRERCWVVSRRESLYTTTNGGSNWFSIRKVAHLRQLAFLGNGALIGAGAYGSLCVSPDSGTTWNQMSTGYIMPDARDLMVLDSAHVFAVGGRTLLKTVDGGTQWNLTTITSGQGFYSRSVLFTDSLNGWIGAEYLGGWGGLYRTTDGGQNWSVQVDSTHRIFDIHFIDRSLGWFGEGGRIHFTSNGGESWSLLGTIPSLEIISILFTSPDVGWCGGYIGLWHSTDGGTTWSEVQIGGSHIYAVDIFFLDPQTGWVLQNQGNAASIYRTTDGGATWGSSLLGDYPFLSNVEFVSRTDGWVVGPDVIEQIILNTRDGGGSWNREDSPTSLPLRRIRFSRNRFGWLLAEGGTILRTSNPVTTVKEEPRVNPLPLAFELGRNYPNPFNPSTTIRFTLPVAGHVTLTIFDVLGRELGVLVNGWLGAGEHLASWSPGGVSSGVYFYRLKTDGFAGTRKLIVLQ